MVNTVSVMDVSRMRFGMYRRLLDLRDPVDYRRWHPRAAENYPYEDRERWKYKLPRDREYILICERGNMALRAADELMRLGYRTAAVVGGYSWLCKYQNHG